MNKTNVYVEGEFCFSGTFISPTSVVTAAHCIFNCDYYNIGPNRFIGGTGLNRSMTFNPGINDYSSEDYYGEYMVTEIYASVSYLLQFSQDGDYTRDCADYDWAICLTSNTVVGTRTHSYMGISGFSYSPLSEPWPFAYNAGYPSLKSLPPDAHLYEKTLWASYPLNKNVTIHTNGRRIESNEIIISGGNSGGPIYTKEVTIQYGQVIKTVYLLGIVSGSHINDDKDEFTSYFYRNTALIVNIARLVAL